MHVEYESDLSTAAEIEFGSESSECESAQDAPEQYNEDDDSPTEGMHVASPLYTYAALFEWDDSPFRAYFPDEYDEAEADPCDFRGLLARDGVVVAAVEKVAHPSSNGAATAPPTASSSSPSSSSEPRVAVCRSEPPGSAFAGQEERTEYTIKLKESPVTKALKLPGAVGVVFCIGKELNKEALVKFLQQQREANATLPLVPSERLAVGYVDRESVGLALAVLHEEQQAEHLLAALQGLSSRVLAKADAAELRPFYKEERVRCGTVQSLPPSEPLEAGSGQVASLPQPNVVRISRVLSEAMRNVDRLAQHIAAVGGLRACRFVAFDCEAAVVLEGAVPLPLEMSFVDVSSPDDRSSKLNYHFFVHPGFIDGPDETTAQYSSVSTHGVPYRRAAFLERDYDRLAWNVDRLWRTPGVILVNKEAIMDVQAIRWLYEAARFVAGDGEEETAEERADRGGVSSRGSFPTTPGALDIPMFDIVTVLKFILHEGSTAKDSTAACLSANGTAAHEETDDAAADCAGRCWYHSDVIEDPNFGPGLHCARADATRLALQLREALPWVCSSGNEQRDSA